MINHTIVLVGFEPDWEALYVDTVKVAEGHHVEQAVLIREAQAVALREGGLVKLATTHVEEYEMNEYGEIDIPETLVGLKVAAPGAYARISA